MSDKSRITPGDVDKGLEFAKPYKPRKPKPDAIVTPSALAGAAGSAAGGGGDDSGPITVCLANVEPEDVEYLWPGRIPIGKLTIIAGKPGEGKTMLTTDIAARVSTGTAWPDGAPACEPAGVLFINGEDGLADTIVPRVAAAGGDLLRVHALPILGDVVGRSVRWFNLDDIPRLVRAIDENPGTRLVFIDPAGAFLGDRNENSNGEVRGLLGPLAQLAASKRVAIVLVTHCNKSEGFDALRRIIGSVGWAGAARSAWLIASDPQDCEEPKRVLMLALKSNVGAKARGLAFRIIEGTPGDPQSAHAHWLDEPVTITADELVSMQSKGSETPSKLEAAEDWLRDRLAAGAVPGQTLKTECEQAGIRYRTLERAADRLGVNKHPGGFGISWVWRLDPPSTATGGGQSPPNPHQTPPFPDDGGL